MWDLFFKIIKCFFSSKFPNKRYVPPVSEHFVRTSVSTFQRDSFEILSLALPIADFNTTSVITRDLRTLSRIGRNFRAAGYRRAIYVIHGWIVGILSAMRGIPCAGFHVPHFAYKGTLHQTRLIRLVTRNREAQRERMGEKQREKERDLYPEGTQKLLSRVEHAKRTVMYPRINVSPSEMRE